MAYSSYYDSIQKSLVERHWAIGPEEKTKHAPIISNLLTEELIKGEVRRYLPHGLQISKGEVVRGKQLSPDCDLIIFKPPPIFQYGSIAIVPFRNVRAIINVEVHGENFLRAKFGQKKNHSKRVSEKVGTWNNLKMFAKNLLFVGLHAHKNTDVYKKWQIARENENIPIFIFYEKPSRDIIEGEFQRLIEAIQRLK